MLKTVLLAVAAASQAVAETHQVKVGDGGLTFDPNTITAAEGDVLEFQFYPGTHDVAMGDFSNACKPAATGGFYSGVFTPENGVSSDVFRVTINSTDPIFFYCSVPRHCSGGMVGVVNPSSGQTLASYRTAARTATPGTPPSVFGGTVGPAGSNSNSPTGSSPTNSPTSSPTSPAGPGETSALPGSSAPGNARATLAAVLGVFGLAIFLA